MHIENLKKMAELVGGSAWGVDKGMPRIYFKGARDRKVFFSFPDCDGAELGGCKLNVFIDDCGQAANWYKSQREREMRRRDKAFVALVALDNGADWAKAETIMEEEFEQEQMDEAVRHFINQRLAEGYAALGV